MIINSHLDLSSLLSNHFMCLLKFFQDFIKLCKYLIHVLFSYSLALSEFETRVYLKILIFISYLLHNVDRLRDIVLAFHEILETETGITQTLNRLQH